MHQSEIDVVSRQRGQRALVIHHLEVEHHFRMLLLERSDAQRQKIQRQRLAAGDLDRTAPQTSEILDLRSHPVGIGNLAARVAHETFRRQ